MAKNIRKQRLLALAVCIAVLCTSLILPQKEVNASAPAGWRNLQDFYVFKDKVSGWSGSGAGELETENGNLPVDTQVTYENLPSLRLNLQTELTSYWMAVILTLAEWNCHDVSQYVPNGYLEFNVKGKVGGEKFVIGAVDHVSERASGVEKTITRPITDYCTVTKEWQHVKIPLKDILDPALGMDPYNAKAIVLDKVTLDPFCVWINQLKITSPDKEKAYPAIKLNQVGFLEDYEKYAYVSGFEDEFTATVGTQFQVRRVSDNSVAYSGQLSLVKDYDPDSGERVLKAVFTDLKQPGEYYITVNAEGIDKSVKFKIGNDVFKSLLKDAARYFYYQRSGTDLLEQYCPDYPRKDRTPQDVAAIFDSNSSKTRDVSKGWFDAGDLGKYVSTGSGTLINLFWSYEMFPEVYTDNQFNIPESGNGIPDILDESRWELEWILKMQDAASGGFYARVQSDDDGNITQRIIKDKEGSATNIRPTEDTACAAAALAHASIVYEKYDSAFALTCLNAAKSAWTYLEQNPNNIKSPNGPYNTDNDLSSRLLAAASLYRATGEAKYNNYFLANYTKGKDTYENIYGDWVGNWNFAFFSYMKAENRNNNAVKWFNDEFNIWLNNKIQRYQDSAWGNALTNSNYYWGSNNQIMGMCMEAVIGSKQLGTNNDTINNMALSSINWILGANPLRKSFVSGYGEDCIKTIFATFNNDGKSGIAKGFMPLGPNRYQGVGLSNFPAKCYLDSADEWTTNEHAIGSASTLVFMSAFANSDLLGGGNSSSKMGDLNADGNIDALDFVLLKQYLLGTVTDFPASDDTYVADLNGDGSINAIDFALMKQYLLGVIDKFPAQK
ncbi:glycoside hydrolase family 9 protein [Ruminiclostridium herbifermentans]|uniref:glycoside hydrolase family 9 protein n=1 Tax=Ruminiclostridium herbifermentans TaxID=2488810 RepID=UPI001FD2707A|nr:glycoside hydrolase family 9 protein [Ruminiclostridium herbifermentans]